MDVKDKIVNVLSQVLKPEYLRLADEEGPDDSIAGYIVSRAFEGMSALARQTKIDEILDNASLSQEERRRVLLIAGLTPEEFKAVGVPIRIDKIKELAGGTLKLFFTDNCLMRSMCETLYDIKKAFRRLDRSL